MNRILFLIPVLLLFVACGDKDVFVLEGTLENGANKTIYLDEMVPQGERLFIDSIRLDSKGHFKFKYKAPYESLYNLHVSEFDYVVLIPCPGEHIDISGDYNHFEKTYTVKGSPESVILWQLQDYSNVGADQLLEIIAMHDKIKDSMHGADSLAAKESLDSIYLNSYKQQQEYVVNFIQENQGSLATLIALYKPFNGHPLIDPQVNFDYYEFVLEGLEESKPENPHTLNFKNTVEYLRHQYGDTQPTLDFELTTNN